MPRMALYIQGDTFLHRLSPVTKLIIIITVMLTSSIFWNPLPGFVLFIFLLIVAKACRLLKPCLKRLVILIPIFIVIFIFQTFFTSFWENIIGEVVIGPLRLIAKYEGLYKAMWLTSFIASIYTSLLLFAFTTHPADLIVAMLKYKIPYTVAFIVGTAFQIVPLMERQLKMIIEAQKCRGFTFTKNPLSVVPLAVPVAVLTIEKVYKMSWSIESRGFSSKTKKTTLRSVEIQKRDRVVIAACILAIILLIIIRIYYGSLYIPP